MTKGTKILTCGFLSLMTCLFVFTAVISFPAISGDIGTDGVADARYHQTLKAEDYFVSGYLGGAAIRNSFFHGLFSTDHGGYYSVFITNGPDSGSEIVVRVVGDEADSLSCGETVDLYGQVSKGYTISGYYTESAPCLNDNGDTVFSRVGTSIVFLVIAVFCGYITWMIATGRTFKRGAAGNNSTTVMPLLLCFIPLLFAGCTLGEGDSQAAKAAYVQMSNEEVQLLQSCYPDSTEIANGKLFDYQEAALDQIRAGLQYVRLKYPAHIISFDWFESAPKFTGTATLGNYDSGIVVKVKPVDSGFDCCDNYYGPLLQDEYDEYLTNLIAEFGCAVKSYTSFPELLDGTLTGDSSLESYLESYPRLTKDTDLFVESSDFERVDITALQQFLNHNSVYGSFTVYSVDDLSVSLEGLRASRRDYCYKCFNCF